jgi:hypothetical protein
MVEYAKSSPYFKTKFLESGELGVLEPREVPSSDDDALYTIESQYTHRPDLLAYDIYGSAKYWWVFAQRNMDTIKDPIYDFKAGISIYLPNESELKKAIGQ